MSSVFGHPGYVFNRKVYRTLTGLMNAAHADSGLPECGFPSATRMVCSDRRTGARVVYSMTAPEIGKQQLVARLADTSP
jgi:hypothetical protein